MAWNATAKGTDRISLSVSKIWHPRIDFISISPSSEKTSFKDETAIVHSDGSGMVIIIKKVVPKTSLQTI